MQFFFSIFVSHRFKNLVKFLTTGIRAKVLVGAMVGEGRKASRIKKFDHTYFGFWMMQIEDGKKLHLPFLGKKFVTIKDEE